jgi:hypothetical protein
MNELKLVSKHPGAIRPLVEGVLAAALRDLELGIQSTEQRLQVFEQKYKMSTSEFVQRYENDEIEETLELGEWIGEYRMLKDLQDDIIQLRDIEFVA